MSSRRLPSLFEKDFGERYTITLSEFNKNLYAHIKNANGRADAKRVSLPLSALREFEKILPEVLQSAESHKRSLEENEEEESAPSQKRAKLEGPQPLVSLTETTGFLHDVGLRTPGHYGSL